MNSIALHCSNSTKVQPQRVNSSQLLFTFTVIQAIGKSIHILSVLNDKLLVGNYERIQLFIYSSQGHHVSTIKTISSTRLYDASWTPRGNIIYTSTENSKVTVLSESGKLIKLSSMGKPLCLSVSNDDIIYLADMATGIYESADDGISWKLVISLKDKYRCKQVIKVTTYYNRLDFWSLEDTHIKLGIEITHADDYDARISKYSMDKRLTVENIKWMKIEPNNPITQNVNIKISECQSRLSYDISGNIFLNNFVNGSAHVFSSNGLYDRQLLSSNQLHSRPCRMSVDNNNNLFYVGTQNGHVSVFKLFYAEDTQPVI